MTIAEQYQKEREKIELSRAFDWSTFGMEYTAAGEKLVPMTVQVWFDLLAINSPLIASQIPTVESLVDYIWRNSKRHTGNAILKKWRLFWIERRVVKELTTTESAEPFINVILEHIKDNLNEFPDGRAGTRYQRTNALSMYSGDAAMVDEIAERYSLHPDEVLQMPLRKAFSLQRVIRVSTIPEYKILEPESLRAIKSKYLQELNNGK